MPPADTLPRGEAEALLARLTAELAAMAAELAEARDEAEKNRRAVVKIAQAGTVDTAVARRDGAREERAAIVEQIRQWAAEGAPGMPEDGDETLVDWIATEIEGRPRGEGQGS